MKFSRTSKVCIILGTRPEIIKMSPIIKECQKQKIPFFIIHTGQHYSYTMDAVFFKKLSLPHPAYNLKTGSSSHGRQTASMLISIEDILLKEKPAVVLVQGDTNSVLSGALAAAKLHIPVGHIEAGLRSYFRDMPEEINRIIVDHISDFLFVPTQETKDILLGENISRKKIFVVGNTIVDSVLHNITFARTRSKILNTLKLKKNAYFLLTIHRSETVDSKKLFLKLLDGISLISEKFSNPIVWPLHPRTAELIKKFNLHSHVSSIKNLICIQPLDFFDFLMLESSARLVLTDSGGVQEESCILKVPCVTVRNNTERPESVRVGANIVAGTGGRSLYMACKKMLRVKRNWKNPFGNGTSASRIMSILKDF